MVDIDHVIGVGMASRSGVNMQGIRALSRAIEKGFAQNPVRVPLESGPLDRGRGVAFGVTRSELDLATGWIMDWLLIYEEQQPSGIPTVATLLKATGNEAVQPMVETHVNAALDTLASEGLIDEATGAGPGGISRAIRLTETGRPPAAARRELRKDGKARRLACRDAVLQWLDAREGEDATTEISEIVRSPLGWFCGEPFTIDDLTKTIIYLREKGLVTGPDNEPRITAEGIDCVERYGGVVEYLNRQDGGGVQVTIQGDNNGQLAVANWDVEQVQNQANDANVLMVFAQALREFAEVAGSEEAEYRQLADMLEAEAKKDDRDEGWVKSLLERARNMLGKAEKFKSLAQLIGIGFQVYGVSHGDSA